MKGIASPLLLPCGAVIPNRLCKAALSEGLADARGRPTEALNKLYRLWSEGGAGLIITGNVQIDRAHLERAGNVVVDGDEGLGELRALAEAGQVAGNQFWMQINHPGRQTARHINPQPIAPSDVALEMAGDFGSPRAMSDKEIRDCIGRFAHVARTAQATGFSGVQIHAAHGYLISQFLSPRANRRTDQWGGTLENRARILLETIRAIRLVVGAKFPVGVKLNSADFQNGGFTQVDPVQVIRWLRDEGVDLVELSGGNYERPSMMGLGEEQSSRRREAYFVEFASALRGIDSPPVMVTGGFRSRAAMDEALVADDTDMIGIGRPMCVEPDLPNKLISGATGEAWATDWREEELTRGVVGEDAQLKPSGSGYYFTQILNLAQLGHPLLNQSVAGAHRLFLEHETRSFADLADRHANPAQASLNLQALHAREQQSPP